MQDSYQNDLRFNTGRYPYAICNKLIRSNGRKLECSLCNLCYHFNCTSLTLADYKYFKSSNLGWTCQTCSKSIFPFHSIEDNELVKLSFNSNLSCLCSKNTVPLQLLFNCSFSTGMVPDQFKVSRVVPIHKKRVQLFSLQL